MALTELIRYVDDDPLPPVSEILETLSGGRDPDTLLTMLRLLCPCRNTCGDREVWQAMARLQSHPDFAVREAAHHTIITLRERARIDSRAAETLVALGQVGHQRRVGWLSRPRADGEIAYPKAVRADVPTLIDMLASDDVGEQADALRALYRTDRHVSRSVWRDIAASTRSADPRQRAKAAQAMRRIEAHRAATERTSLTA